MTSSKRLVGFLRIMVILALLSFSTSLHAQIVGWKQIGPAPLVINPPNSGDGKGPDSGTVVDIAIDPSGPTDQVIYIAGSGGVWKTTDAGKTWTPKTDFMPTVSVGAVALDPANPSIVYAGTGNAFNAGSGIFESVGVYRSIDGGDSWIVLNPGGMFTRTSTIQRMVLPARDLLIVATNQGLFRSIDGGQNFGANPPLFNDRKPVLIGFISDLKVDTASSSTIYAAVAGSGIFKSTDSGATFPSTPLFSAASVPPTTPPTTFSFIAFAQSTKPNNQSFYANVDVGAGAASMFKSANGGLTWTVVASNPFPGELQNFYDQTVGVDPQDANRVYFGLRALYESKDGGASGLTPANRTDLNQVHADQHALIFSPPSHWGASAPTRLYNGTDGGIATTANEGANWDLLNNGLATMLFYQIDIGRGSPANNQFTYGAAQDLGLSSNNRTGLTGLQWLEGIFNDGFSIAVDPLNPTHAIGNQNGTFTVSSSDGTAVWPTPAAIPAINGITAINNVAFDPNGGRAYVVGGTRTNGNLLLQSTDNAATFAQMHVFPQILNNGGFPITISKADSNIIWVALLDGTLQRTSNALTGAASTWTSINVSAPTAPNQAVAAIAIDPTNTNQVVVVYNGFSTISASGLTGHVFMTSDNGKSWSDISGNLPDTPLTSVIIDPGTSPHGIVVAGWGGVFRSGNGGTTWESAGAGFPNAFATSLAFDANAVPPLLRAGTFGRSAWELTTLTSAPTALTYTGATSGDFHDSVILSARLILGGTTTPVVGQTITFSVGAQSCPGVTNTAGTATCDLTLNQVPGAYVVKASFAGAGSFQASSMSLPFTITREETTLNYTGDTVIANGTTAHLSAVLLEDGVVGIAGRTVIFTLGAGSTAQKCTQTTNAAGVATCTIFPVSQPFGAGTVTAEFAGDAFYLPSSARASTIIFAFLAEGAFVLGDSTAAVAGAGAVEFWGADWARQNVLSGGGAPDAFKGFASVISTNPPACSDTWLSQPGNSSKPPDTLPPFMGVVVSSIIRQSGPTISGNVPKIVVVETNGGYAPDPGDRGTGRVVAVYCK